MYSWSVTRRAGCRELQGSTGTTLYSGGEPVDDEHPLKADDQQNAEVAVTRGSPMDGASLKSLRFEERHQVIALALHRAGKAIDVNSRQLADRRCAPATCCSYRARANTLRR